jgi:magnesium transporter
VVHVHRFGTDGIVSEPDARLSMLGPDDAAWVDIDGLTAEDAALLGARFGFHPLAVEDCVHPQWRAKFERFPSHAFLVLQPLDRATSEALDTRGFCVFVRGNLIVSVRQGASIPTGALLSRIREWPERLATPGERVVHAIFDVIVDEYTEAVWALEARVDGLDAQAGRADAQVMDPLVRVRRELLTLRRLALPQREVIRRFVDADAEVSPAARIYFRDVLDHIELVHDETNLLLEVTNGAMQLHASAIDNRLNASMRYMAIVSTILLPMTVISGAFGMNFDHIPWQHVHGAFEATLVAMFVLAAAFVGFFKWRRWL